MFVLRTLNPGKRADADERKSFWRQVRPVTPVRRRFLLTHVGRLRTTVNIAPGKGGKGLEPPLLSG